MPEMPAISMSTDSSEDVVTEIRERLIEYNDSCVGTLEYTPLILTVRSEPGELLAGLVGRIYYSWIFVEFLWVAEQHRGQGLGRALLVKAEEEAVSRGCTGCWLDTFDFQARGFYERYGYSLFGELSDYPPGHKRYFLQKNLRQ
jgi:GNAT superfamily N-acetyltransferase